MQKMDLLLKYMKMLSCMLKIRHNDYKQFYRYLKLSFIVAKY